MRVLFCGRLDILEVLGGDTIQILETKAALERRGLQIDIGTVPEPDTQGYDLVHIFNTQFPALGLPQLRAVKRQGCPVALSPVYWDMDAVHRSPDVLAFDHGTRFVHTLGPAARRLHSYYLQMRFELHTPIRRQIRQMLLEADALLPNSVAELEILVHQFEYTQARSKAFIVPNAVRENAGEAALSEKSAQLLAGLPDRYILEAARVESVKGQLQLLRASVKWCPGVPLVFVGGHAPNSRYFDEFERQCREHGNAHYLGIIPHEEMPAFYARAKVHALPSLRESPGLATLEAALAGANCVVGIHAPVQEYFRSDAWVCDPEDIDSLGRALQAAWEAPNQAGMRERIRRDFTWDRAADETLRAYEFVLGRKLS